MIGDVEADFEEIKDRTGVGDTAAAILVLASAIRDSQTFNRAAAENFGHELALALKNVIEESVLEVSLINSEVDVNLFNPE